ncbi:MAG: hypothetical protein F4X31_10410 [Gammaproteobacteria bacterium]|nr:hypothetical protein [Gammaproteobacteria bacterium]
MEHGVEGVGIRVQGGFQAAERRLHGFKGVAGVGAGVGAVFVDAALGGVGEQEFVTRFDGLDVLP